MAECPVSGVSPLARLRDPFTMQDRPVDLGVTYNKHTEILSDSIFPLLLETVTCQFATVLKKNIPCSLKRPLNSCLLYSAATLSEVALFSHTTM